MQAGGIALAILWGAATAHAAPRTSANYRVSAESFDGGGQRATSPAYTHDGSLGGVIGVSNVASPTQTVKSGYIGQLYEITALQLAATPAMIDETATRQLSAGQLLDDDSLNLLAASEVTWGVQDGPLSGIDANGLATAGPVYEDTAATAQGIHAGFTGTLGLTVLDSLPDNFGSYAGDGLGDDWQVLYFGLGNLLAGPLLDPDGDSQNNAFEFTAGLDPTNPLSHFLLEIQPVPGQPAHKNLIFGPRFEDRNYTVMSTSDLSGGSWDPTILSAPNDNGSERTVTDTAASAPKKFYRVEIEMP